MQSTPEIIELLNEVLTAELTAINQYFIHYKMQENWGYQRLASKGKEEAFGEMKHAEELIERILYLEGVPNMQRLFSVKGGETLTEQLQAELETENEAIAPLPPARHRWPAPQVPHGRAAPAHARAATPARSAQPAAARSLAAQLRRAARAEPAGLARRPRPTPGAAKPPSPPGARRRPPCW